MNVNITSNAPAYRDALIEWMAAFHKGRKEALRTQGRLLGERVIRFTPPKNQAQGRSRVSKDIKKIFTGMDDLGFSNVAEGMRQNIVETVGGEAVVRVFAKKDGTIYGVDRNLYRPDATLRDMAAFHQSKRDKRGRIGDAGQKTRDIGRWKFLDRMVVPAEMLKNYIKTVQANVGEGRGGWAAGVIALGGKVTQWVGKHAGSGSFEDRIDSDGYIQFTNKSRWASGGDEDRIIDNAIKSRTKDILAAVKHELEKSGKRVLH